MADNGENLGCLTSAQLDRLAVVKSGVGIALDVPTGLAPCTTESSASHGRHQRRSIVSGMIRKDTLRAARKSQAAQHAGLVLLKEQNRLLEKSFNSAMYALELQSELLRAIEEENDALRVVIGAPKPDKAKDDALKECAAFFQQLASTFERDSDMEVCGYCGERRGEKYGCCGENHWDEVDDDPEPCECRQAECESKSDER